jgi:glycosyltransferase involved in cell wall biosynthesis
MKEIIVYYPRKVSMSKISGGTIRPFEMISAFEETGFTVHKVVGDVSERKILINNLKQGIQTGNIKPAFVYMESTNLPLPLSTSGQKIPAFYLDIKFLRWLKYKGFKIGLFYRDLYWKFNHWWRKQGIIRGSLIWPLYYYELYNYVRIADIIFCPSAEFGKIIQKHRPAAICIPLPPGCSVHSNLNIPKINTFLDILYVGGCTPPIYDLSIIFAACNILNKNVHFTVCTRRDEWHNVNSYYEKFIGDNVSVIHEEGLALKKRYLSTHVAIMPIKNDVYRDLAMPLKLFEAIGYCRPIIVGANCAAGRFVQENEIGWAADESIQGLVDTFLLILKNPTIFYKITLNVKRLQDRHTWQERAKSVAHIMMNHCRA